MCAQLAVCGTHHVSRFGHTIDEIEKDEFEIIGRIDNLMASDAPIARAKSMANELAGLCDVIMQNRPEFIVILGDREDCLAAASLGVYAQIPVVHLGGGDAADDGNSDNPVRDAVTKLSHLHLATSHKSRDRLIRMGEEPWRCHVVGATGLDRLRQTPLVEPDDLWPRIGVDSPDGQYAVVIQHALLPEHCRAAAQMTETLEAMHSVGIPTFVSRPNSDPGSSSMHDVIYKYASQHRWIQMVKHLPREEFVNLLRHASVLVGNSSAGILEAPYLNLPTVNVGCRQVGREHAENVVFVNHDRVEIEQAVLASLREPERLEAVRTCSNPYGDGHAAERCVEVIRNLSSNRAKLVNKVQGAEA